MENNRELNEMIFQNYGELYDALLTISRRIASSRIFPSKATDTTNNQTSCFLSAVLSTDGDAKTNTAALFNIKSIADGKKAVIWGGLCRGAKIVIANRPERKAETEYVKSVLRAFQDI